MNSQRGRPQPRCDNRLRAGSLQLACPPAALLQIDVLRLLGLTLLSPDRLTPTPCAAPPKPNPAGQGDEDRPSDGGFVAPRRSLLLGGFSFSIMSAGSTIRPFGRNTPPLGVKLLQSLAPILMSRRPHRLQLLSFALLPAEQLRAAPPDILHRSPDKSAGIPP